MKEIGFILGVVGFIAFMYIFVWRNPVERPEKCTCKTYNWLQQDLNDDCPVHKHMRED